ncbi:hypothetical protein, partial [Escherichia coli]|uniref:hypothetical protein n=1 Tax=Escherichia coli TaxID=562 RepID=UPI001FCEE10E
ILFNSRFRSYGAQGVLKKHPFCGAFLVFWGFKFLSMNKAEQHFHSQEVKNESEQAKYADRQMERKAEVQKQLVAAGNVRQRIPADTQRLLRESISEFNADADKG